LFTEGSCTDGSCDDRFSARPVSLSAAIADVGGRRSIALRGGPCAGPIALIGLT
jgi:hypothetical protein